MVVFIITVSMDLICSNKPFNPILGETYQGHINQCPIYLEQVSHHPPLSSYLYIGRGYRTFGYIEPKIKIGLNHAQILTDRPNRVL